MKFVIRVQIFFAIFTTFASVKAEKWEHFKSYDASRDISGALISRQVEDVSIGGMSGKKSGVSWTLKNIRLHSFSATQSANTYISDEDRLKFEVPGIKVKISAKLKGVAAWFIKLFELEITLDVTKMSIEQIVTLGFANSRIAMVPVSCKTNVNSFNLIVNSSKVPSAIKNLIKPKIQAAAEKEVCVAMNKKMLEYGSSDEFQLEVAKSMGSNWFF